MKVARTGGSAGISNWNLDAFDKPPDFQKWIQAAVNEAMDLALKEPCDVGFDWNDPDRIIIWLPFGEFSDDFSGPEFSISLSAAVREEIKLFDPRDKDIADCLGKLRDIMRKLADEIDAKLVNRSV